MHGRNLAVAEGDDFADLRAELDMRGPAANDEASENQYRFPEIADLLDLGRESFEGLTAILRPRPPRPLMALVDGGRTLEGGFKRGMPLDLGVKLGQERVEIVGVPGLEARRMVSTFSCDIAYSDSPAASRASARSA
jgi:hypothetical protein